MDMLELSDPELYRRCQEYGMQALVARRKFAGLLPEVKRRELYRRRGFASIHEFAAKLAGMSADSVDKVLRLAERLTDKPFLKVQFESGAQGWSKIEKVSFIATPETDKFWSEKVELLSQPALEAFVQSTKTIDMPQIALQSDLENKQEVSQVWSSISFPIAPEVEKEFRAFKEQSKSLTFNEAMKKLLDNQGRRTEITLQLCPDCVKKRADEAKTRYIPAEVRKIIQHKYKGSCGFPGCIDGAKSLHHTRRYVLNKSHDPDYIVPLCVKHERLVHSGLVANENLQPDKWRILNEPDRFELKFKVDQKVQSYRK